MKLIDKCRTSQVSAASKFEKGMVKTVVTIGCFGKSNNSSRYLLCLKSSGQEYFLVKILLKNCR